MTRSKENLPSRKGIGKIFSIKVIRLLITFLASILLIIICLGSALPKTEVSADTKEKVETVVIEKYVKELGEKDGYEDIHYELNAIYKFQKDNNIYPRPTINLIIENLDDIFIKKYDYYVTYYKVNISNKEYLFKHEEDCKQFIQTINKYDSKKYEISKVTKLIKNETSQNEINEIIETKKKEYEKAKAAEEAARKARERAKNNSTTNSSGSANRSAYQNYAHDLVIGTYGWSEYDFECLVKLWNRESGWNPNAHNKSSGAHGIPQSLPASKMVSEGSDYYTNGETQIRWGLKYIAGRYDSPANAWTHSQQKGWY